MANKSKLKGTEFETLIKNYMIEQGFDCERQVLSGSKDVGDLKIFKVDAVFELKNHKTIKLADWLKQTEIEKSNAKRKYGFTIFKRKGKGLAEEQYVLMTVKQLAEILKKLFPEAL